jgi:hypothetical protein
MSHVSGRSLAEGVLLDWAVEQPTDLPTLPVALLSREQTATELQRVVALRARVAAYEAELVLGLVDDSPEEADPPAGARGARGGWTAKARLPGVSEFLPAELAMVLNCGRGTASQLAVRAHTYRENLPGSWAAMAAGVLDEPRAKALAEVLEHADRGVARRVEAELLPEATGLSLRTLRERALALLLSYAPKQAEEAKEAAEKSADVRLYPSPREGMTTVAADLPADEAAACYDMLNRLAAMLKADGDPRFIGQLRTRVFTDLHLRPWDDTRPPVTAQLHIVAPLAALEGTSTEAGEVSGLAVTAAHLRALLRRLDALGVRAPDGGSVTVGVTDDDGALLGAATLDQLRTLARRGCPDHPDPASETGCNCPVLARPAATDGYTPSRPQQRFVHTRDRTCRFPHCGQRVGWADADHVLPHARGGTTDCSNLCCLCRSHHRLKTFARGWRFAMSPDGTLTVTTPSGVTRSTRPPGLRPPPEPPPPEPPAPEPPPLDPASRPPPGGERRPPAPYRLSRWLIEHWQPRSEPPDYGDAPPPF